MGVTTDWKLVSDLEDDLTSLAGLFIVPSSEYGYSETRMEGHMYNLGELQDRIWKSIEEATATKDAQKLGVLSVIADDMEKRLREWDKGYREIQNGGSSASSLPISIPPRGPSQYTSGGWVTADDDAIYTGRNLRRAILFDADLNVHAFNELVLGVVQKLRSRNPVAFAREAVLVHGRKPYFSDRQGDLRKGEPVEGTKIFVETNLSSNYCVKLCHDLLIALGEDPKDLKLELTPVGATPTRTRRRRRRQIAIDEDYI
jgi:hypothetical protein